MKELTVIVAQCSVSGMMNEDPLIFLQDMLQPSEQEKDIYIIHGHTDILYDIESMFKARVLKRFYEGSKMALLFGPSGIGKSFIIENLCKKYGYTMLKMVPNKYYMYIRVGHKNQFPSVNSVPAVFGCQMVQAFQKYQAFCHTTSHRWCDIYFSPKNPKEGPLSKKNIFIMKHNNMGIKSCVLMPLNTSCREKIKISSVFSARNFWR